MSTPEDAMTLDRARKPELSPEHQSTADLLKRILGSAISDRYIDFCRLSTGAFDLRVSSPLAGHALRELESMLRQTLAIPFAATTPASEGEDARLLIAANDLRSLGFDSAEVERATNALRPRVNHKTQIREIAKQLGLDEGGDIANAWIAISQSNSIAHKRSFARTLVVDDEFRSDWSDPFQMVIRGIAVQLQSKYAALMARVEMLASMPNKLEAIDLYVKEIPGALTLQWHFYRNISGPGWLPALISRNLLAEPDPYSPDDAKEYGLRRWPIGFYLLNLAKAGDAATRKSIVFALRPLATSSHPDVRRDALEILAALPASDLVGAVDLAVGWLAGDQFLFGTHFAERIVSTLAAAGEAGASLKIAAELYKVKDRDGEIETLFTAHMYEHSLFQRTPELTSLLKIDVLSLFCDLLYQAALIARKIEIDPFFDHTTFSSFPLPQTEAEQHDVYGALTCAVLRCTTLLVDDTTVDGAAVLSTLMTRPYLVYKRIALKVLARRPDVDPSLADTLLLDAEFVEAGRFRDEYAELAIARFAKMEPAAQAKLLAMVDEAPEKYLEPWRARFNEYEKRLPSQEEEQQYRDATVRDLTWYWRAVLPAERQKKLEEIVARLGDPDAWRLSLTGNKEESPLQPVDFVNASVDEIVAYLSTWAPEEGATKQTKTALSFELRRAIQSDPKKFCAGARSFVDLSPIYVRQLLEGLQQAAQSKAPLDWLCALDLSGATVARVELPVMEELVEDGDDPSWFWAAKSAVELVRTCLLQGNAVIPIEYDDKLRSFIKLVEYISPGRPELADFEERYERSNYFGAEATMFGLAAELNVLYVSWLSSHEQSGIFAAPREALANSSFFTDFAARALDASNENARIVRAVFGRYLSFLIYFGEDWVRTNFSKLFPQEPDLWGATWSAHLVNDNRPARDFVERMRPFYEAEIDRLGRAERGEDRDYRQDKLGEFLMVLYLWGVLPADILDNFLQSASRRLRRHVMWFLGRDLQLGDMPDDIRERAVAYWEMRLALGMKSPNKDDFRDELGAIGTWRPAKALDAGWLIGQQTVMFRAGFAPGNAYSVVDWAAKVASDYPDEIAVHFEALISNPNTDRLSYAANEIDVRKILTAAKASSQPDTQACVRRIVSYLASMGDTSFLDLIKDAPE